MKVQEDTEVGTIVQEMRAAVEEEEVGGQEIEAQAQEVEAAVEGEVATTEEAVEPAMGKDEKFAQRPKVMGGLLQATPWLGNTHLQKHPPRDVSLREAFGLTQIRKLFTRPKPPPGEYQRGENPGGAKLIIYMICQMRR